jgi:DNA-binding beta-propeller fold protein YncE
MKLSSARVPASILMLASLVIAAGCAGIVNPAASQPALAPQGVVAWSNAPAPLILVADFSGDSILGYPPKDNGNATPSIDIAGSKTGFGHVDNIAIDSSSRIYANVNDKYVAVFASNANGNVSPISKISGSNTQLSFPIGVAVDSKGYLYVADCGYGNVKVFKPGAHGNVAPIRVIGLTTGCTIEEAVDSKDDLYVTSGDNVISEFSPYSEGNNLIKQIDEKEISGGVGIRSIAIDSQNNIYVGNLLEKDVLVYAPSASGPAIPIRKIAGSLTHLGAPSGLSIDGSDALYVTVCHYCHQGSGTDSVLVFAPKAKGNVKPRTVIQGKKTELFVPTDVVVRR